MISSEKLKEILSKQDILEKSKLDTAFKEAKKSQQDLFSYLCSEYKIMSYLV